MTRKIEKVAVIGSGTMGAGIAGVCAAAGTPVVLLDLEKETSQQAIERLTGGRKPVLDASQAALIEAGSIADDMNNISDCDWICEVIVENLQAKRDLFTRVEALRKDGSIVTSNTSGIPLRDICEGMPQRFQRDVAVTHFFNPVHIMRLLELVAGEQTEQEVIDALVAYLSGPLSKGVVYAKDTVNFIGNRIGCFWILAGLHKGIEAQKAGITLETVDALLSKPLGLPPTGLYGLIDLIGLDVMDLVAKNLRTNLSDSDVCRSYLDFPPAEQAMIKSGQLGRKTGGGYYKMNRDADGNKSMEVFDLINSEWRAASPAQDIQHLTGPKSLLFSDGPESAFAWDLMSVTLSYAADLVPEIADDIVNVDRAMRWGFSWSHGPFELLDLIGPAQFTERLRAEHREVPKMLALLEASGSSSFYQDDTFFGTDSQYHQIPPE